MDVFLDNLWDYLAGAISFVGESLFGILENFHFLGPAVLISLLAFATVCVTKLLSRWILTRRYIELEKEYMHWFELRQEAMKCEDSEKGKRMARNIDKAELNKAYYDYFFEGFMLGVARKVIPIFFMFAFINEFYRPERMLEYFGREFVFQLSASNGEPVMVGAVFWYIVSLLTGYILWSVTGKLSKRVRKVKLAVLSPEKTGC